MKLVSINHSLHRGKQQIKKLVEENVTYNTTKMAKYLEMNLRTM